MFRPADAPIGINQLLAFLAGKMATAPILGHTCPYADVPKQLDIPVFRLDSANRTFKKADKPCKTNGILNLDVTFLIKRPGGDSIAATIVERSSAFVDMEDGIGVRVNGKKVERQLRSRKHVVPKTQSDPPPFFQSTWDVELKPEVHMTFCSFPIKLQCIELELEFQGTDCKATDGLDDVGLVHLKPNIVQADGRRSNELVCVDQLFQLSGLISRDPKVYLKKELMKKDGAFYHSGIVIRWYTYGESKKQFASLFTLVIASGAILNYSRFYLGNEDHAGVVATVLLLLVQGVSSFNMDFAEDVMGYCVVLVSCVLFLFDEKYVLVPNILGFSVIFWMIMSLLRAVWWVSTYVLPMEPVSFLRTSIKDGDEGSDTKGGADTNGKAIHIADIHRLQVLEKGKATLNRDVGVSHKLTSHSFC